MRIAFLLLLVFSLVLPSTGQSLIKTSKSDKSTSYIIETKQINLAGGVFNSISISIKAADTVISIWHATNGIKYTHKVADHDPIVFNFQDGATVTINSWGDQGTQSGRGTPYARQEYRASYESLLKLKEKSVTKVVVNTRGGAYDYEVDSQGAQKLKDLASAFLDEFDKQHKKY